MKHVTFDFPHEALSTREREVLRGIAEGKKLTEIARLLDLSVKTVSTYRARLCKKMQMFSAAELAIYAHEHGMLGAG